jgi:hypothetical protein
MPMGFYTKETFRPFYTTEKYLASDQGKQEAESIYTIEKKINGLIRYPAMIIKMVWHKILVWSGYLVDLK